MKTSTAVWLAVLAFALGGVLGSALGRQERPRRAAPDAYDPDRHAFEIYCPGDGTHAPFAGTLLVAEEVKGDRPVWTVRESSSKGVATYLCQSAER